MHGLWPSGAASGPGKNSHSQKAQQTNHTKHLLSVSLSRNIRMQMHENESPSLPRNGLTVISQGQSAGSGCLSRDSNLWGRTAMTTQVPGGESLAAPSTPRVYPVTSRSSIHSFICLWFMAENKTEGCSLGRQILVWTAWYTGKSMVLRVRSLGLGCSSGCRAGNLRSGYVAQGARLWRVRF